MSCPMCSKKATDRYRPFCSKRCADVDLGRWLNGSYTIPTDEAPETGQIVESEAPPERS